MGEMNRGVGGGKKKEKMSPAVLFMIAAGALLVAVALFFVWTPAVRKTKQEKHMGEIGVESKFSPDRTAGINLPYADQAVPGTASPDTTLEIPIEWKGDVKLSEAKFTERYDAIEKTLTKNGEMYDEAVTFRIDRDLEYRTLYQAVSMGVERGFVKFHVACHLGGAGGSTEVRYLRIEPPSEFKPGKNALLWRIFREGDQTCYAFGVSQVKKMYSLKAAAGALKITKWDADKVLVLGPALDLSVQNVVEALNVAANAGAPKITLNLTKVE